MAPYLNMILKADINRIYDEKYLEAEQAKKEKFFNACLLYTSPSPRDCS